MAQLKELINKRGNVKGKLKRYNNHFENSKQLESILEVHVKDIARRYCDVKALLPEFERLHDKITNLRVLDEERAKDNEEFELFETMFYTVSAETEVFIEKYSKVKASPSQTSTSTPTKVNVGLPDIALPRFNGTFDNWREFIDTFTALVHSNAALSPVEKLHYLKSCMIDEAASVINMLAATEDNYEVALQMLQKRFEHKRLTVNKHISNLYSFPKITKGSAKEYRSLMDTINTSLLCLKSLNVNTSDWDPLLIFIIGEKIDLKLRQDWESKCDRELPKFNDFLDFLGKKCELLESFESSKCTISGPNVHQYNKGQKKGQCGHVATNEGCPCCKSSHNLLNCQKFKKLQNKARYSLLKKLRLCFTCFEHRNGSHVCTGQKCTKCGNAHHTMLHFERTERRAKVTNAANDSTKQSEASAAPRLESLTCVSKEQILLSTAMVKVKTIRNELIECRVLLDNGSQPNLITSAMFQKLGIISTDIDIRITGINNTESGAYGKAIVNIMNNNEDYDCDIICYIVKDITGNLPATSFSNKGMKPPPGIILADPTFNISRPIDMLLGADVFYDILSGGQIRFGKGMPILQKTKLGWIVGGGYVSNQQTTRVFTNHCVFDSDQDTDLNKQVKKFWEMESIETADSHLSIDDQRCEEIFKTTTRRDSEGRFIVKVPWKGNLDKLGNSLYTAKKRFFGLERKLQRNLALQQEYISFMNEYKSMGHMKCIDNIGNEGATANYYIPHHAVVNASSTTTKVRVVFDASCKTDTDTSLNDLQLVGPTIQSDLFSLLVKFRKNNIVLTADIKKMYRQIKLHEEDKKYHRIFWRANDKDPLKCYELQTVTYGTASAPFLAVRCLFALAEENELQYPREAKIIKEDFYVDDLLTGADTIEEMLDIKETIKTLLQSAGLNLHKWASNHSAVCPELSRETSIQIGDKTKRTLGTHWQVDSDSLHYKLDLQETPRPISKRSVLSTTAKIFDPLGILGPIIVIAKIIFQESWQARLAWDDPLPENLQKGWVEFEDQLKNLSSIKVPRQVFQQNYDDVQLHGFCDASIKAYGACVYVRSKLNDQWNSTLLCAKSKVAPLSKITLPRLELQGAVLLAKLISKVQDAIKLPETATFLWCDSTIVLGWIKSPPNRWKLYVANRVAQVQQLTGNATWNHVSSLDNPADVISRGATIVELNKNKIWWSGPTWLNGDDLPESSIEIEHGDLPEERKVITTTQTVQPYDALNLLSKFSSASKLIRVIAYCRRFIGKKLHKENYSEVGPLTTKELNEALKCIVRKVQAIEFKVDITAIKLHGCVSASSKLKGLSPIIDQEGILRVGGRLHNDIYPYDKQHPMLLPKNHNITLLLMQREHLKYLHCGPQALLALVRERFWPLGGRCIAKQIVKRCVTCFRQNPKPELPIMGNLPSVRTTPKAAFTTSGVDYAGPIFLKDKRTRGSKLVKAYICLFVCFVTKAIHLELVSELTTECFLAALRRFASRRGKPEELHSDNATNFRGAQNELLKLVSRGSVAQCIKETLAMDNIEWKFIPPRSPHFGGLWEASVKSVKSLLKKVLGNAHVIYEEMYTVLVQVEAILNSRPISSLSNDPNDLSPLTPGHFLIGRPMTAVPDQDVEKLPISRLSRYQRLQQLQQHFWRRWSREYVCELQQRHKWTKSSELPVGAMVLLREDNVPPLKWQLGRVIEVRPGGDNIVRVARVKTASGECVRAVQKLCILPFSE